MQINFSENTGNNGCISYIAKILSMAIAIIVSAYFMQPHVNVSSFGAGLLAAIMISVLNIFLRPILLLLTLPFSVVTLGLFVFVINACMIWLSSKIIDGFFVENFGWAFFLALIISAVSYLLQLPEKLMKQKQKNQEYYDSSDNSNNNDTGFTDYEEVDDEGNSVKKE